MHMHMHIKTSVLKRWLMCVELVCLYLYLVDATGKVDDITKLVPWSILRVSAILCHLSSAAEAYSYQSISDTYCEFTRTEVQISSPFTNMVLLIAPTC